MSKLNCKAGRQIPIPEPPLVCGCVDMDKLRIVTVCALGLIVLVAVVLIGGIHVN